MLISRPNTGTVSLPNRAVKITRNISGKAKVKNAEAGLRQNALFVKRTWRTARPRSLIYSSPVETWSSVNSR